MFDRLFNYADVPARAAMSAIFILSGASKVSAYEGTQGYMEAFGIPGILLAPTIAFEVLGGLALLLGLGTRLAAFLLAGFSVVSALVFHTDFADQVQMVMFLKNIAMAGGLLLLAKVGSGNLSLANLIASKSGDVQ